MRQEIKLCYESGKPCEGKWGCRFLKAPKSFANESQKSTFIRVYRLAKSLGIIECPRFVASKIDEELDSKADKICTKTNLSLK